MKNNYFFLSPLVLDALTYIPLFPSRFLVMYASNDLLSSFSV